MTAPVRIPFPVVDEVSRHCLQEAEPETVHIEVHLPGPLDHARLRKAFLEALHRHPRILMREARGPWYRRQYEWELTPEPDVEVVTFAPPGPRALHNARTRALTDAPPLSMSPPIRLEVVDSVLLLTINHTALDGPACLRVLATAAELYAIRARLMDHFHGRLVPLTRRATHYGWELCKDPAAREAELLEEHQRMFGKPPRLNIAA